MEGGLGEGGEAVDRTCTCVGRACDVYTQLYISRTWAGVHLVTAA